MSRSHRLASCLAAVVVALGCLTLSAPVSAAAVDAMTEREAGKFYLAKACQAGAAYDRMNNKIWGDREWITYKEVQRRLQQVTYETDRYGKAALTFATKLMNPPAPWPESVGGLPDKLANAHLKYGTLLRKAGAANSGREWGYYLRKADKVEFGQLAARIRATLDLPPSGEGC
jgi:hypothetical protein